jgi:hypothetical protein
MNPHVTIALGGHRQIAHRDGLDPAGSDPRRECGRARGHPEHLDAERGGQGAADGNEQRHAPHHAALRIDADDAPARRGSIDLVHAAQGGPEAPDEGRRVTAKGAHRREAEPGRPVRVRLLETNHAEHDAPVAQRAGEQRVVVG